MSKSTKSNPLSLANRYNAIHPRRYESNGYAPAHEKMMFDMHEPGREIRRPKLIKIVGNYHYLRTDREKSATIGRLADYSRISENSARKVIKIAHNGCVAAAEMGTPFRGAGSLEGLTRVEHRVFIYTLYSQNAKLFCDGYIYYIYVESGTIFSRSTISRWFYTIGPF